MSSFTRRMPRLIQAAACLALLGAIGSSLALGQNKKGDLPFNVGWSVGADPGEKYKGPFNIARSLPVNFLGGVFFPSAPTAYMAIAPPNTMNIIQVYDLRTMKAVGKPINVRFTFLDKPVLSPDGKHLALRDKSAAKGTVTVWSVATGKMVREIVVDDDPEMKPKYIDLLGKGRLWVAKHKGEFPRYSVKTTFQVFDVNTGKEVSKFTNPLVPDGKWFTISAGRRYQWMEQTGGWFLFLVWDLTTGKMVGAKEFQGKDDTWGIANGLAFSPDGAEMAMLWRPKDRGKTFGRLMCWDTRTGKKLFDHTIENDWPDMANLGWGNVGSLQWWPERSGWLVLGHLLIDRDSGAVVHRLGARPNSVTVQERRFLDKYHVTDVSDGFVKQLRVIRLPKAQIDAAVKKARGKGK